VTNYTFFCVTQHGTSFIFWREMEEIVERKQQQQQQQQQNF
jgi:hypothetical protein